MSKRRRQTRGASSRKRQEAEKSSEEEEEVSVEPAAKRRKIDTKQYRQTFRKALKTTSVYLEHDEKDRFIEVAMMAGSKRARCSYAVITGKIGTKGRQKTKLADSKQKAITAAVNELIEKIKEGYTVADEDEEDEEEEEEEKKDDRVFKGCSFALSGSFKMKQEELSKLIKKNGGVIKTEVDKHTDYVIVKEERPIIENKKCERAKKLEIPILTEDFLHDSIAKKTLVESDSYEVETDTDDDDEEEEDDMDVDEKENQDSNHNHNRKNTKKSEKGKKEKQEKTEGSENKTKATEDAENESQQTAEVE